MTELEKAAMRMALEFCELCWRDVSMNDYALEKLEQTTAALAQALATTEPVPERLREAFQKRGFVVPNTLHEAINSAANIMCEDGTIIAHHDAKRTTTERKLVATPDHNGAPVPASPADMQVYDKIAAGYWTERKGEPVARFDETKGRPVLLPDAPMLKHGDLLYTSPQVPEDVIAILDECRTALIECDRDCDYELIDRAYAALDAARK